MHADIPTTKNTLTLTLTRAHFSFARSVNTLKCISTRFNCFLSILFSTSWLFLISYNFHFVVLIHFHSFFYILYSIHIECFFLFVCVFLLSLVVCCFIRFVKIKYDKKNPKQQLIMHTNTGIRIHICTCACIFCQTLVLTKQIFVKETTKCTIFFSILLLLLFCIVSLSLALKNFVAHLSYLFIYQFFFWLIRFNFNLELRRVGIFWNAHNSSPSSSVFFFPFCFSFALLFRWWRFWDYKMHSNEINKNGWCFECFHRRNQITLNINDRKPDNLRFDWKSIEE